MTVGEIYRRIEAYNTRHTNEMKERAVFDYNQAQIIAQFVGKILGSKTNIPNVYNCYPELFNEEVLQEQRDIASAANFLAWAKRTNDKYLRGEKQNE